MNKSKVKVIGTDILEVMGQIVERRVRHFKSDFDIDREILTDTEKQPETAYLWLVRECGTWLLPERNLLIRGTREHSTLAYYAEQERSGIALFIVEATGKNDTGELSGNIYRLPGMAAYHRHILSDSIPAKSVTLQYERGRRSINPDKHFGTYPDKEYGKFVSFQYEPELEGHLAALLREESRTREKYQQVTPEEFLSTV